MGCLQPWFRHSASAANRYRSNPSSFLVRYGYGLREEESPKATIGKVVEEAVHAMLLLGTTLDDEVREALGEYDEQTGGLLIPERGDIPALIERAYELLAPLGIPLTYQLSNRIDGAVFALRRDVQVVTDFGYGDFDVDLKCTWALPARPKFDHACQTGTYWGTRKRGQRIAYVTPKKSRLDTISEADLTEGWETTLATWRRIEALDALCATPADAAKIIPLQLDDFRFGDPKTREEARKLWKEAA